MKEKIKQLFNRFFDYEITGEYYDTWQENGVYHYCKKYNKKYFLKCLRKK